MCMAGGSYSTLGILMKTGPRGAAVPIHRTDQKPPEETVEITRDAGREERLRFVFFKSLEAHNWLFQGAHFLKGQ